MDRTKFKLTVAGADWLLEEPENGISFWEGVFQTLATTPAFVPPKKDSIIKIGIPGSDTSVSTFSDSNVRYYSLIKILSYSNYYNNVCLIYLYLCM